MESEGGEEEVKRKILYKMFKSTPKVKIRNMTKFAILRLIEYI